ncbi:MAG: MFS transporter [Gammaproteobacteria bacterium]|nr:MFS transporter [Gammaproteobacteria bacterium]
MAKSLIGEKRFLPYFCTQFLGAFNDNIYRNAFAILITYFLTKEDNEGVIVNAALVAFILPFFLFGAIAGQLADKFEKAKLIRYIKVAEILIMLVGSVALYMQSVGWMLTVLFALGSQSAFFGPIKYSILPQHVNKDEILSANAYVEAGTFVAILLGTILGGTLANYMGVDIDYQYALMGAIVGFAILGWFASALIPYAPAASPELKLSFNVPRSTVNIISKTHDNKPVFAAIMANSWFWFFGAVVMTQFPVFAKEVLSGDAAVATLLLATFSIGIGLGSFACSAFSRGHVEMGLVPFGAFGISLFSWLLSSTDVATSVELRSLSEIIHVPGIWWVVFNLTMIAFSSGLFIVPLYAFMQVASDEKHRSRTIAVNNILNSIFMVIAGGLGMVLTALEYTVLEIYQFVAIANAVVAAYIFSKVPEHFLRLLSWLLMHSIYRIKKRDLDKLPKEGPVLVVCNHVSFFDPPILLGVLPRAARFVMWHGFYDIPVVGRIFKWLKTIPIGSPRENPELIREAYDKIAEELEAGNMVVIFPEGHITRTGELNKFQPGIDKILKRTPVPVVPMALRGMWGTWTSRKKGRALKGFPTGYMKRLTVIADDPIAPEEASRSLLFEKVLQLRGHEK